MGCIIKTRNPIKGNFHTSLVAYMLTESGVSQDDAVEYLKRDRGIKPEDTDWGILKNGNYNSDFSEADIRYASNLLFDLGKADELDWMEEAQNFYDSRNISLDQEFTLEDLVKIKQNYDLGESDFTFKIVEVSNNQSIVNGVSQKRYKIYPVKGTYKNKVQFKNTLSTELSDVRLSRNTRSINNVKQVVDLNNPNLVDTIQNILNSSEVSEVIKKQLRDLLPLINYYPNLSITLTPVVLSSEDDSLMSDFEKKGNLYGTIPGAFDPNAHTVVMSVTNQNSVQSFAETLTHELQHAATLAAVYNPKTEAQKQLSETIHKAYKQYIALYKDKLRDKTNIKDYYGFTNPGEFIVAFMGNPAFRDFLKSNNESKSLFQTIIDAIKKFFNITHNVNSNNPNNLVTVEEIQNSIDDYFDEVKFKQILPSQFIPNMNKTFNHVVTPEEVQTFRSKYSTPEEFREKLESLLDSRKTNWSSIYQNAVGLNLNKEGFYDIVDLFEKITLDETKESIQSLYDFLHETALYLRNLDKSLTHIQESKILSERDYFTRAYYAKEVGMYFKEFIEEFKSIFENRITGTIIENQVKNIESLSKNLSDKYISDASSALANMLAEEFKKPTEKLKGTITKEIERLNKILESAKNAGNRTMIVQTQNKIEKEKQQLKKVASVENLRRALKGEIEDVSTLSLYLESAALTGNLITGTIGGYLSNIFDDANAEAMGVEVKAKRISKKLENYLASKKQSVLTGFTINEAFDPFYERKTILELKNGELVERESIFLIQEMDEIAYMNDKLKLEKELMDLKNSKKQTPEILNQIKQKEKDIQDFIDKYEESIYTEEYYRIQNLLSDEAKEARKEILDEMFKIKISPFEGEQSDEELDKLDMLKVKLSQLESDYDEYGVEKDEQGKRIAQNIRDWKKERNAAELIQYEITEEHLEIFNNQLNKYNTDFENAKKEYETAVAADDPHVDFYLDKYKESEKNLTNWKKNNAVRKINQRFYIERKEILDELSLIQDKYKDSSKQQTISELWSEMFALLRGYKNEDGLYEGSKMTEDKVKDDQGNLVNISTRIKQLEDQIEKIKDNLSNNKDIPAGEASRVRNLLTRLSRMQENINTPDYVRTLAIKKAEIRSKVVANPQNQGLTRDAIEVLVNKELFKTEWYKDNHRKVMVFNEKLGYSEEKMQPIFVWRVTEPKDKSLITYDNPSFKWATPRVNPKYINPNRNLLKKHKRVSLKKTETKYQNPEYKKLKDPIQREILNEMVDLYMETQKGTPLNLKRGLEVPYNEKSGIEAIGSRKVGTLSNQIKGAGNALWDEMTYQTDNDLGSSSDEKGSILNKYNRRLYLKYSKRIDSSNIDRVSINLLNSIAMFGADTARFRHAYKNLPYIYGIQDVLEKNMGETNIRKVVNNMLERRLNAQSTKTMLDNKLVNFAEWTVNKALSFGAYSALSLRLPSTIKNNLAGNANIYIQADLYGISRSDINRGKAKVAPYFLPLFQSYVEDGIEHEYIQKVKYFNILPENHLADVGKKIFVSELNKKSKQYNPLAYLSFLRNFGEFEMRASVAEALSQTYLIEHENGKMIPIMDSFELVDGVLTPMSTIKNKEDFNKVVQHFRGELNLINSYIHGAYGYMDKAEYTRYTLGRLFGFMKGWLVMQGMRRFGKRNISYRAGVESQGFYRTLIQAIGMFAGNRSLINTWELLSTREKNEVIAAGYDTLAVGIMTALSYVISLITWSDSDDDDDNYLAYFFLYNILQVEDELSTLHPISGPMSIAYSRFINNPNGKSPASYYLEKTFLLPFRSLYDVMKMTVQMINPFDDVDAFDDYIPRSRNGNILNPKQFPRNPFLEGQSEVLARSLMLFGLDATWNYTAGLDSEFMYRKYERLNERWFVGSLDEQLSSTKSEINSSKKQIANIKRQLEYTDDEDTRDSLLSIISDLEKTIDEAKDKKNEISQEIIENQDSYIQ